MSDKIRKNSKLTIPTIANILYHAEQFDLQSEHDYETLIHNCLSELNKQLHSKLSYDDAENLFNMMIDYGEHCSEKLFEEGIICGIRLFKELCNV